MGTPVRATRDQLAASQLLRGLSTEALEELAGAVTCRRFEPGDQLCTAGEPGTSAFLVVSGRLRAEAGGRTVGEVGRGELVGEISLLTGEPRSATVTATRQTETLELSADVFNQVLAKHPQCYQSVSSQLVNRLQRVLTSSARTDRAIVLALLSNGGSVSVAARELMIEQMRDVAVVRDRVSDVAGLELSHDCVVIAPPPGDSVMTSWALSQSDRTLLFVDAASHPDQAGRVTTANDLDLVLVQPPTVDCPKGTSVWLEAFAPHQHHHIRAGNPADANRVLRRLRGAETVLVLSGGGARGLAHAGLFRALLEQGVAIDAVAGVSAGAVAAAVMAMGVPPQEGGELATRLFGEGSPIDLTLPTVAMASGGRLNQRLKDLCGEDRELEDLWLPATFVSANLTTAGIHLHQRGSLWRALRASTAIPGVFPPVAEPYGLLVDGGIVSNLPVDLVRELHPGATVIASDVGKKMQLLPDDFPRDAEVTGWKAVRSRIGPGNKLPGMIQILAQLTALGGAGRHESRGDLHIEFDLGEFGMFDFKKSRSIIEAGYLQGGAEVQAWLGASRTTIAGSGSGVGGGVS